MLLCNRVYRMLVSKFYYYFVVWIPDDEDECEVDEIIFVIKYLEFWFGSWLFNSHSCQLKFID